MNLWKMFKSILLAHIGKKYTIIKISETWMDKIKWNNLIDREFNKNPDNPSEKLKNRRMHSL